jgi:hypothetical protein
MGVAGTEANAETENSGPATVATASCSSLSDHDSKQDSAEIVLVAQRPDGGSTTIPEQHLLLLHVLHLSPVAFPN